MDRRRFLSALAASCGAALPGCTIPDHQVSSEGYRCSQVAKSNDILRIDAHCHLLNHRDANGTAFVVRRYFPDNGLIDAIGGSAVRSVINIAGLGTNTLKAERELLDAWIGRDPTVQRKVWDPREFCETADRRQTGIVLAEGAHQQKFVGTGRVTGFASSRLRNAAVMMSFWPEIDIFMPLMIDFYEGRGGGDGEHPEDQAKFYRDLNLASRGRFLPLVSFNPEREMKENRRDRMKNLELVRTAIEDWGFIGVKVHPSAGFNAIDNADHGCPNTAMQWRRNLTSLEALAYDRAMERLYKLCDELDAPILTHGSTGLSAHELCMHGQQDTSTDPHNRRFHKDPQERIVYRDPKDWTNATPQWLEMLDRHPDQSRLRVCIAHYASRFEDHLAAKPDRNPEYEPKTKAAPYNERPENLPKVEYNLDGTLKPSAWLAATIDAIKAGNDRVFLDLSHMTDLVYSAAARHGEKVDHDGLFSSKVDDGGRYAVEFMRHLETNKPLWRHILYGSDWHMPEISKIGPSYRRLIEGLLPAGSCKDIMGRNAVRFFGLGRDDAGVKRRTRQRLEAFYQANGIPEKEIRWLRRVDDQMSA